MTDKDKRRATEWMARGAHKGRYVVGIDPGKVTGFAVYDRKSRTVAHVGTTDFWGLLDLLNTHYKPESVYKVVVEVPPTKRVFHRQAATRGAIERTSVNVGSVIRESELLAKGLERLGYNVCCHRAIGKQTREGVKMLTGFNGRTNQHERDALMLCFGI